MKFKNNLNGNELNQLIILIGLVLTCHGLLILNDGVYWDGWIVYGLYQNSDDETLIRMFSEAGHIAIGYFHRFFWILDDPIVAYKLTAFVSILTSSILVLFIAKKLRVLSCRECLFIASVFGCYPAYQVHTEIIMVPYIFCYMLFWFGAYFFLLRFKQNNWCGVFVRIISLFLFWLSFSIGSLLVFYFPVLFILILFGDDRSFLGGGWNSYLRYLDYFVLPFAFWAVANEFFSPFGLYSNYNKIQFDFDSIKNLSFMFINQSILVQFNDIVFIAYSNLWLLFLMIFFVVFFVSIGCIKNNEFHGFFRRKDAGRESVLKMLYVFLFSFALIICAIFPYVLVGKVAAASGWESRMSLLVGLPVAIALVGVGRFLAIFIKSTYFYRVLATGSALLIAGFVLSNINTYLQAQTRWIKDRSVIANLKDIPKKRIESIDFFLVDDLYKISGFENIYRFYEYSGIFKSAWGEEKRLGIMKGSKVSVDQIQNYPLRRFLLKDFKNVGEQAILRIEPGILYKKNVTLVFCYFKNKWFNQSSFSSYIKRITNIKIL